jgi:hypothetical protein
MQLYSILRIVFSFYYLFVVSVNPKSTRRAEQRLTFLSSLCLTWFSKTEISTYTTTIRSHLIQSQLKLEISRF